KRIPQSVKGRRAHPPKPQKILIEEMNLKEYSKALASAIASTANKSLLKNKSSECPIVMDNSFEKLTKTKQVISVLQALKVYSLVEKSKEKTHYVSGIRHRSKRTKFPKSVLVVVGNGGLKAARNLSGVDVVSAKELQVRHLAPGTHAGRVAVYTEDALKQIKERFEK
ncbi:50S ribosomal protein L4, partial [Candidatus Micrarchaeota archaeon]|nr:50S ribosomal protein L4 [Candidatus Micrarchaeota archaeon]